MRAHELLLEANVFNVDDVVAYVGRFADQVASPEGKKFFQTNLRRWLLGPAGTPHQRPLRQLPTQAAEWAKTAHQRGNLVVFTPDAELDEHLGHLADFVVQVEQEEPRLLSKIARLDPPAVSNLADRFYRSRMSREMADQEGVETVIEFPDGYRWVNLRLEQCLSQEGDAMGNCVATHWQRVEAGKEQIYSLRDPRNRPHATVAVQNNQLVEAKGKQNKPVIARYEDKLIDLFNHLGLTGRASYCRDLQHTQIVLRDHQWRRFSLDDLRWSKASFGEVAFLDDWQVYFVRTADGIFRFRYTNQAEIAPMDDDRLDWNLAKQLADGADLDISLAWQYHLRKLPHKQRLDVVKTIESIIRDRYVDKDRMRTAIVDLRRRAANAGVVYDGEKKSYRTSADKSTVPAGRYPDSLTLDDEVTKMQPNTTISGALFVSNSPIRNLPSKLRVDRDLSLTDTEVEKLGNDTWVKRVLKLTNSKVEKLPANLTIGGKPGARLDLRKSNIRTVPNSLRLVPDKYGNVPRIQHDGNVNVPEHLRPYEQVRKTKRK